MLRGGSEPYPLSVATRVPIPLQPKVKEELDRLQAAGVIASREEIGKKSPHLRRLKEAH